jgi:tight adherence protein B
VNVAQLVPFFGAGAVLSLALAFWLPGYAATRATRRRMAGFVAEARAPGAAMPIRRGPRGGIALEIERRIGRAKVDLSVGELALTMFVFGCGAVALLFSLFGSASPVAVLGAPIGAAVPLLWLRRRERQIQRRFQEQLPETVILLANALHAGLSVGQAFERIARDSPEPTRTAFQIVVRELGLGIAQSVVLERLRSRHPSEDVALLAAALDLHQEIGGRLPRMLDVIATTLRERTRIEAEVAVLTSQQRYSAYVLAALPVLVAVGLFLISPDYIGVMFETPLTRAALAIAAVLVVAGFITMQRLARVDV